MFPAMLLPILLGAAVGGGALAGTNAIRNKAERRKQEGETANYERARANPGVTTWQGPMTGSSPSSPAGAPQAQPQDFASTIMQSTILGQPITLPGPPMNPPILKKTYDPAVFTRRTIDVPDHLGGGTLTVEPNEGGFYEASMSTHRAHYQKALEGGTMTPQQVDLKAMIGAEFATASKFGRAPQIEKIRALTADMHDVGNQFVNALSQVDELIDMDVPWSNIPKILSSREIYIPPENLERIREFLLNKYKSWGAKNIQDPTQLDEYMRAQDRRFGIPTREPVARVSDLGPDMVSELAQMNIAKETPVSALGAGYGGTTEKAREMGRYHERPRIEQTQAINLSGPRMLVSSSIAPIMEILDRRKGADLTGPLDSVKKVFDKYGVPGLSDQDRVAVRSFNAQLIKVLYDLQGKQLSELEIKKAEGLLPDIKMDETTFRTQVDIFTNYVTQTSLGNLSTLHRANVDIGAASIAEVEEYNALREEFGDKLLFDYKGPYVKDEKTGKKLRVVPNEE